MFEQFAAMIASREWLMENHPMTQYYWNIV
jgi:hypothetical protein